MQAKLAAIAAHAQYSNLGLDAAWQQLALADDVIALVAAARRHERSSDLAALSSAYVDLLAERLADAPAAVAAFVPLCTALGECRSSCRLCSSIVGSNLTGERKWNGKGRVEGKCDCTVDGCAALARLSVQ